MTHYQRLNGLAAELEAMKAELPSNGTSDLYIALCRAGQAIEAAIRDTPEGQAANEDVLEMDLGA